MVTIREMSDSDWDAYAGAQGWSEAGEPREWCPWFYDDEVRVIGGSNAIQMEIDVARDSTLTWTMEGSFARPICKAVVAYIAALYEQGKCGGEIAREMGMVMA